ncbi:MAG: response regulator [Polyangia bacterium]
MSKILMIDDDSDFHDAYEPVLTANGYEVAHAYDPEEGIEKVESEKPDLVVLDIMMPDGHEGFEVARKIRKELQILDLPIIVLSSIHESKQIPYRFDIDQTHLPVDLWLDKPVDPGDLLEKVRAALNEQPQIPG